MPYTECLESYLAHYIVCNATKVSDVTEEFMVEAVKAYQRDNDCFVNVE